MTRCEDPSLQVDYAPVQRQALSLVNCDRPGQPERKLLKFPYGYRDYPAIQDLIMHLAGQSRGTAGGMFSTSNQFGGVVGASAGGLMLSLGGYPTVGLLCLVATVLSASVLGLIMRRSPVFRLGGADIG